VEFEDGARQELVIAQGVALLDGDALERFVLERESDGRVFAQWVDGEGGDLVAELPADRRFRLLERVVARNESRGDGRSLGITGDGGDRRSGRIVDLELGTGEQAPRDGVSFQDM
jgi:hypothetical protein